MKSHSFLLILAALLWGTSFVIVQDAITSGIPVSFFLGARYLLASLIVLPWVVKDWRRLLRDFLPVLPIGIAMLIGNFLQTLGLQFTTAANSAFITGLNFIFTPLFGWLFWKTRLEPGFGRVIILALIGFTLLCWNDQMRLNPGDLLTLLSAFMIALQILWIDRAHQRGVGVGSLVFYQTLWVGLPSLALALSLGELPLNPLMAGLETLPSFLSGWESISTQAWIALGFTALACSALAFWAQAIGQKSVTPARTALIFILEPVSGAFLDYLVNGIAPPLNLVGGLIVILALVVDWLQTNRSRARS